MRIDYGDGSYYVEPRPTGWVIEDLNRNKVENRRLRKKLREMYTQYSELPTPPISFGHLHLNEAVCCPVVCDAPTRSTNMYLNEMKVQEITSDDKARDHLRDRLLEVYRDKDEELHKKYGLYQKYPETRKELADALKNGQFTISGLDKKPDDHFEWHESWCGAIRFTTIPEDQKGYNAAHKKLSDARLAAKDMIIISSPADGLKAFREFEATTFS